MDDLHKVTNITNLHISARFLGYSYLLILLYLSMIFLLA